MKTDSGYQADSLCDFLTDVQDIHASWEKQDDSWLDPWFRGISNADHTLLPGFYRPAVVQARKDYEPEDDDYRIEFELKATPYLHDMRANHRGRNTA